MTCKCGGELRQASPVAPNVTVCASCGRSEGVQPGPLEIWTDGSVFPNPGNGGWGWVRSDGQEACGGVANTTNNRMELTAILKALESLATGAQATIYSDSQYCVNGLTSWHGKWKSMKWRRKGVDIPNRDLWMALDVAANSVKAKFKWVRGHNGNPGNERADKLAEQGRVTAAQGTQA